MRGTASFTRTPVLALAFLLLVAIGGAAEAAPDLSVAKSCASTGGQSIQCTVTVTNIGDVPTVSPMSITDTISGSGNANLVGAGGTLPASCTPGAQLINDIPLSCPNVNTSLAPSASGTFLVSYTMPQGGNFTNCVTVTAAQNASGPGDPNAANNTNVCTSFTVAAPVTTGSITIVKDASPNDAQDFTFTSNQSAIAPFPLDDDSDGTLSNQKTFSTLPAGTYTFTETTVSGWTLSNLVCTGGTTSTNIGSATATITLAAGDNVTCTFTNTKPATGSITIVKDANPNDAQDFTFTSNQAAIQPFPLDDDSDGTLSNQKTFASLPAGTYTFTETTVSGWTLSNLVCTGGTATTNIGSATATITLAAGDNVTCTFTNTKPANGSITIVKDANPNDAQDFTFTSNQAAIQPFPLDDDSDGTLSNQKTFASLPAGTYTFTETTVSGWTLSSLTCTGGTASTNIGSATATITLAAGDNVTCTFTNSKPPAPFGKICGVKFNDLDGDGVRDAADLGLANWQISTGLAGIAPATTGGNGEYCVDGLPPGTYTLSEIAQAPWQQTFPAAGTHTVVLQAGQTVTGVDFGNTIAQGTCSELTAGAFNLIANGNFEQVPHAVTTFDHFDEGAFAGWDTTAPDNSIEVWNSNFNGVPAYSGARFIELNANGSGEIHQHFTAVPGHTLTISFAHRGRATYPNQMSVAIGETGGTLTTIGTYTAVVGVWTLHTLNWTVPAGGGSSFHIRFVADDPLNGGNLLDAIQVIDGACASAPPNGDTVLADNDWFEFFEDSYPHTFAGEWSAGTLDKYDFRYYSETGHYLALDDTGAVYALGPITGNVVTELGTQGELEPLVLAWTQGPVPLARVFAFAEANYPALFAGPGTAGQYENYRYRHYAATGNILAVDNAGVLYLLGPASGNQIRELGPVEAFRVPIEQWYMSPR